MKDKYNILIQDPSIKVTRIPFPCPICDGKLVVLSDKKDSFFHAKRKPYHMCTDCEFEEQSEIFKKRFLTQ